MCHTIAMDAQTSSNKPTTILMLPWIGYGHVSAYLELAKVLSTRNFHIYFCSTPANLNSIKPKLNSSTSIEFIELHLPSSDELPPHLHTANALPARLAPALRQAFEAAAEPFEAFLQTLCPHLLIYDSLQPWAPRLASSFNIPAINFNTTGAFVISHALHNVHCPHSKFPFSDFVLHNHWKSKYANADATNRERLQRVGESFLYCLNASCDVTLINTFRELEGKHIDYVSDLLKKRVIPIGPLVYEPDLDEEDEDFSKIKNWLDKKEPLSTVLVSFGSEFFPSKEEIGEIAHGLEQSEANFIWVMRFPKGEKRIDMEELLPEGYLKVAGERAMVVEEWAAQGKILKHGSIGGFVSHCGWNSAMESVMFGVPVIGVPMNMDQPYNAGLMEESGVGVEAKRDAGGKIQRGEIAKMIKDVVVEKTREDIWKRIREIGEILRREKDEKIDKMVAEIHSMLKTNTRVIA